MRQPTIARARPRAASTEARTALAVGALSLPVTSQSIDTPNARAIAATVSVVARCRSVSSSATWDGESPESALASRAETPAISRSVRSLDASDMVPKPLAAASALVKRDALDVLAEPDGARPRGAVPLAVMADVYRLARHLFGPNAIRRSLEPLGVPARVVRHDGATAIVVCCTLAPDEERAAVADAVVAACRDDFSSRA